MDARCSYYPVPCNYLDRLHTVFRTFRFINCQCNYRLCHNDPRADLPVMMIAVAIFAFSCPQGGWLKGSGIAGSNGALVADTKSHLE